jgi:Acetyltransferase (GNAT) domain
MKHHLSWISAHSKTKGYWEAFGAFLNEQMVGFITFSPAKDFLGIQICYYTSALYHSKGVCTLLAEVMVQRAFVINNFHYAELHIDVENIGSQRVAEKNGFEVVKDYLCSKSGNRGSGKMQVWVKINPKYAFEMTLEEFRNGESEYLAPAYQSLSMAFQAIKSLQELSGALNQLEDIRASAI